MSSDPEGEYGHRDEFFDYLSEKPTGMDQTLRDSIEKMLIIPETEGQVQKDAYDSLAATMFHMDHASSRVTLFESILHIGRLIRYIAERTGGDPFMILDAVAETAINPEEPQD